MKIVYVHGFGSKVDITGTNKKYKALKKLGEVFPIAPDYEKGCEKVISEVTDFVIRNQVDLLVGTSMGGWCVSRVGVKTGTPFVSINPSIKPNETIKRYPSINESIANSYSNFVKDHNSTPGIVIVALDDEVLNSGDTIEFVKNSYRVITKENGGHRMEDMDTIMKDIESFYDDAVLVNGYS